MPTTASELPQLQDALTRYAAVSGKSWGDIVAKEGREWAFELSKAFSEISPSAGGIYGEALSRGFTLGRKGNSLTASVAGVSTAAMNRARSLLGGQKSDYFRVEDNNGAPMLKRVRFSKFVRKGERKMLIGGRFGNKYAAGSLHASEVEQQHLLAAQARHQNLRQLNLRAVATAVELAYRARAARGHLMGNQWLPKVYTTRGLVLKSGPLISRSTKGQAIGQIDFTPGPGGEPIGVTLAAFVEGTERQAQKHGIPAKVQAIRVADRMAYVERKLAEDAATALRK